MFVYECVCIHNSMKVNVFDTCIFAAIYAGYICCKSFTLEPSVLFSMDRKDLSTALFKKNNAKKITYVYGTTAKKKTKYKNKIELRTSC